MDVFGGLGQKHHCCWSFFFNNYGGRNPKSRPSGAIAGASTWFIVRPPESVFACGGIPSELWLNFRYCRPSWCGCFSPTRPRALAGAPASRRVIIWVHRRIGSGHHSTGTWESCWWISNVELSVLNGTVSSWMFRRGLEVCSSRWRLEWGGTWMEWTWSFSIRFCNFGVGLRRIINTIDAVKKSTHFSLFLCLWNELSLCR